MDALTGADADAIARIDAWIEARKPTCLGFDWDGAIGAWGTLDPANPWASLQYAAKHFMSAVHVLIGAYGPVVEAEIVYAPRAIALSRALDWAAEAAASFPKALLKVRSNQRWFRALMRRWGWERVVGDGFREVADRLDWYESHVEAPLHRALITWRDDPRTSGASRMTGSPSSAGEQGTRAMNASRPARPPPSLRVLRVMQFRTPALGRTRPTFLAKEYPNWTSHGDIPGLPGLFIPTIDSCGNRWVIRSQLKQFPEVLCRYGERFK